MRLNAATALPDGVDRPRYDRDGLRPGILHFGLGAFHRAHQAVYTEAVLNAEAGPWGIVAVNLRSPAPVQDLQAQDGLYSVITRSAEGDRAQVVGATCDWICAAEDPEAVLAYLADARIRVVTLTVTEKAYGLDPETGALDRSHPSVAADISTPERPSGPIGWLVEGLRLRHEAGTLPFTVLCCDNLPSNGRVVRRLVLELAEARDPALSEWIAEHVAFPCSMVDRIVPAATDATRARANALLGAEDAMAIETEPFIQWVIEDHFPAGRPDWQLGGAVFAEHVEPYEKMKLRLLNGSHTLIAHLGVLHGLEHVRDVMAVPELAALARSHMQAAVQTLDPVPGIDLDAYMDDLIARFANPAIAHRNIQIAMDTTQKLPQRLLSPAVDALAAGSDANAFARAIGIWIAALALTGEANDPRRDELISAVKFMPPDDPSASFFAMQGLFPQALTNNRAWRDRVNAAIAEWRAA
ncbi:mannitol dehydrogenase family protein [Paracoccus laeviglucosivorans]|uniref:Fructuronate reductase n=1 Tax=Paracoccus laeviglucosivorans TaxID=1197861 RepID=A0A521F5Z7_9RHOB|nr:mannitol dehydrogenase family protein [Paracoccus laeviglucosivorans]SMO91602.1 fructuronate reductase [Paracoccus laeviglucosivorans]